MEIKSEADILDQATRVRIIEHIESSKNKERKDEDYKRYLVYKDKTSHYVLEKLLKQFETSTVMEMSYALSNVSILRKVIDKLARVYSNGVKRTAVDEAGSPIEDITKNVEELSKILKVNTKMKKTNRAYKRDKNTLVYLKPLLKSEEQQIYSLELCVLFPYLYDAIENEENKEEAICYVLSHYEPRATLTLYPVQNEVQAGNHSLPRQNLPSDQHTSEDRKPKQFIWWTNSYHFTTNEKGEIISATTDNPILEVPFVNFAEDQDGCFWATGGNDLADGSVLVNSMITHTNHVGITQGYGQFYMTGKNLPKGVKIGPSRGIGIEYEKEDPVPALGFLSANPALGELRSLIEMYVALMLTTNNLSVSGVATQLGNAQDPASGIAIILDKAESMEDVKDQEQIFLDNEPVIWRKLSKWMNFYNAKGMLDPALVPFTLPEDVKVTLKFGDAKPIMSEKEMLENIQLREELGLNTKTELLMMDDPSLTEQQAEEKLKKITEENMQRLAASMGANGDQGNLGNGNAFQNFGQPGVGPDGGTQGPAGTA